MDWCIQPPDQANHNPVAVINGNTTRRIINIRAFESDTFSLSAAGSYDPDGDKLSYHWFVYKEAGTFTGDVTLLNTNAIDTKVVIPNHVANGYTIHVILEVTDNREPSLYAYRRAIITVVGK